MNNVAINMKQVAKTNEEIQHAFYHLMYQFRQINSKYGLMIGEEIEELYDQKKELIHSSKGYMKQMERRKSIM